MDLETNWNSEIERARKLSKPPSLVRAIGRTYRSHFVLSGILQLLGTVILQTVLLPFALRYIISFASKADDHLWKGYFISCMLFAISFGFTIFLAQFYHIGSLISMRMRTALGTAIYKKVTFESRG